MTHETLLTNTVTLVASRDAFNQYFDLSSFQICADVVMLRLISQGNHTSECESPELW